MNRRKVSTVLVPVFVILSAFLGTMSMSCFPVEGGMNMNEQGPGNPDGGIDLGSGEDDDRDTYDDEKHFGAIAVDNRGRYFLTAVENRLVYGDLVEGTVNIVNSVLDPGRAVFANTSHAFIVTSVAQSRITAYDAYQKTILWDAHADVGSTYPWLDITADDSMIFLTYVDRIDVLGAEDGRLIRSVRFDAPIEDVDVIETALEPRAGSGKKPIEESSICDDHASMPLMAKLVVTLEHSWLESGDESIPPVPETEIHVVDLLTWEREQINVPNCTSELVIEPSGRFGYLAPTRCVPPTPPSEEPRSHDPVSVIDFKEGVFVRNLPGFGPVALSPRGTTAVAFMDRDNLDESLFDDPSRIPVGGTRYRIMAIDTRTLAFDSFEIGDSLPRYALTPDGSMLLVDVDSVFASASIRILDLATGRITPVSGESVQMDEYVMTSDSKWSYILDQGEGILDGVLYNLYELSIVDAEIATLELDFEPSSLNITPDDAFLLVKDIHEGSIYQYDVLAHDVVREFEVPHF